MNDNQHINRRKFLRMLGLGGAVAVASLTGCKTKKTEELGEEYANQVEPPLGQMTYRTNPKTGDKISILGYGMMRLPTLSKGAEGDNKDEIDQEQVNRLVDYAIEHGVNYFDTSPAYCQGLSERSTGIALHRHPRDKYFVATKLSNFNPAQWPKEESVKMYHDSMRELQVDYIDYYLLHSVGGGGMENFRQRYLDNGMLDFLMQEREKGKIKNLGFSYHGDIEVFDYLLEHNDQYHWDFVQIQFNYVDWEYADETNPSNADGRYLYEELQKRGIPAVIMEPLLGGRLAKVPQFIAREMKKKAPGNSIASWAFRYAGSPEGVLTVLSGMTYMEHLKDNLLSYCPLKPVSDDEKEFLYDMARKLVGVETIPCNDCNYCMPCPYGINIPAIFVHYNKFKNEGTLPNDVDDEDYEENRRKFLISLDRTIPRERQADHCIGCGQCVVHCPQNIKIPKELQKIDKFVEQLKQGTLNELGGYDKTGKSS